MKPVGKYKIKRAIIISLGVLSFGIGFIFILLLTTSISNCIKSPPTYDEIHLYGPYSLYILFLGFAVAGAGFISLGWKAVFRLNKVMMHGIFSPIVLFIIGAFIVLISIFEGVNGVVFAWAGLMFGFLCIKAGVDRYKSLIKGKSNYRET